MSLEGKKKARKRIIMKIKEKKAELSRLAAALFTPAAKDPYYLNRGAQRVTINNLIDLRDNLDAFTHGEALWLASWIEYLGDPHTAGRIRENPEQLKEIVAGRYDELREFYTHDTK